jgi:protease IV
MTDQDGQWERGVIERLAGAALKEQRSARRWSNFWKLLFFLYLTAMIVLAVDWKGAESHGGRHTALVELNGVIAADSAASADRISDALEAAFRDKGTKGVVLRINSPGGSPVQSQNLFEEIRRLRKKYPSTPLYAVVEDVCASGGYYVAAAADRIYVSKASLVGSIGVRLDSFGLVGLMDKLGIERRLLTAGTNKGMLDPFLPLQEKQKEIAQDMLDDIHRQFIAAVREGRGRRLKETPDLFSGVVWTGAKSVELGLADGFGTLDSVARDVIKAEDVVDYTVKENVAERLARRFGAGATSALLGFTARFSPDLR